MVVCLTPLRIHTVKRNVCLYVKHRYPSLITGACAPRNLDAIQIIKEVLWPIVAGDFFISFQFSTTFCSVGDVIELFVCRKCINTECVRKSMPVHRAIIWDFYDESELTI